MDEDFDEWLKDHLAAINKDLANARKRHALSSIAWPAELIRR